MVTVNLQRCAVSKDGVFGVLSSHGRPLCLTLERPWERNKPNTSCIPSGVYDCYTWNSQKFGKTFQIGAVPDRQAILIHRGNTINDTQGCILVGEQLYEFEGHMGLIRSREAMKNLLDILPDNFEMSIAWPQGFDPKAA